MTLEQAKALVPDKDYVIYDFPNNVEILRFKGIDLSDEKALIILDREGKSVYCVLPFCHLLGEYRGSFDSSVLPPKATAEDDEKEYSIDVFINIDGELATGYFFYPEKKMGCIF